jgi:hypothetical protein
MIDYLYLLTQDENNGYDTYDSAIVCATSEEDARRINPAGQEYWDKSYSLWASSPDKVTVTRIGIATVNYKPNSVILASFNAG